MTIEELYELYKSHPVITTDSRNCPVDSIFIALHGESFDGNLFAISALEKGCAFAIVDTDPKALDASNKYASRLIRVQDTLQTFKDMARQHRRQFDIPVIGITGTNGKTTTKELIAKVLGKRYNVMFTQGNFNNDVGVPKTLFTLSGEHDIAVVEMGASHPGDIKTLVETVEPTCGLITNVGRAHLQGFGSFEGVKRTKGELYDFLVANGRPAFLNTDDADLTQMAASRGLQTEAYAKGRVEKCTPYLYITLDDGTRISTRLIGAYNLPNILAAVTVGRHFGVDDRLIVEALEEYSPSNSRSQLMVTDSNHLVVDAYNANPTSMAAAVENFRMIDVAEPKMLILGDMGELGAVSEAEHRKIAEMTDDAAFREVWLVGNEFQKVSTTARRFVSVDDVKAALKECKPQGMYILVKGSHSTRLYELPELL